MFRFRAFACLLLVGLLAAAAPVLAKEKKEKNVPDVTGVWKGTSDTVAVGKLGHVQPAATPTFLHVAWTLTIDKQEGPVFYGTKASAKAKETVVGVLRGTKISMADDDGTYSGRVTAKNRMILTYVEAGKDSKVASVVHYLRDEDDKKAANP